MFANALAILERVNKQSYSGFLQEGSWITKGWVRNWPFIIHLFYLGNFISYACITPLKYNTVEKTMVYLSKIPLLIFRSQLKHHCTRGTFSGPRGQRLPQHLTQLLWTSPQPSSRLYWDLSRLMLSTQ